MKHFLFTMFLVATMFASAQNGTISGKIMDAEEGNNPLLFAKVTLKETGAKVMTDAYGVFTFENLENGTYTLVCSFTGYDSKEIITEVSSKTTKEIKASLNASSLSLDDLAMAFATSEKKDNIIKNN